LKPFLIWVLSLLLWLPLNWGTPAVAATLEADTLAETGQLFELHCAGCHLGGGNIIRRNKTLKLKALQRNQMDSVAAIAEITTYGKANMSAYSDRLTEAEIQQLAAYVLERAENNWK
jgi:cytochrome c6